MCQAGSAQASWRSALDGAAPQRSPDEVRPATREETLPVALGALVLGFIALIVCVQRGYLLLYGDAVAHLGIARRILDSRNPGLVQLGGVWLPLPHLLMLPFVQKMEWWQNGLAGAWPSLLCYILGVVGTLPAGAAHDAAAVGAWQRRRSTAESEPALPVDHGDDGAALSCDSSIWLTLLTMECVGGHPRRRGRQLVRGGCL